MKEYSFTLKFNFPDARIDPVREALRNANCYVDRLYKAGCDDALIGIGKQGSIALEFFVRGASLEENRHHRLLRLFLVRSLKLIRTVLQRLLSANSKIETSR